MGQHRDVESLTISADDTFTAPIVCDKADRFTVSISGAFVATVTFQRRMDGLAWLNADSFTAAAERDGIAAEAMEMRLGIRAGQYTSGSAVCRIAK